MYINKERWLPGKTEPKGNKNRLVISTVFDRGSIVFRSLKLFCGRPVLELSVMSFSSLPNYHALPTGGGGEFDMPI